MKATSGKLSAALELTHSASLIHDDIIDHAELRHYRPTVNHKWGRDVAIASGDYLYTEAFRLIAQCGNSDILSCISQATKLMCEANYNRFVKEITSIY
ncbi:MAG: polyprenyl synthetase family protein [Candidatus Omnitrophica bacterium]|nr:polyprenyl synthetase family protein [Candidatus Omnitrophota bacterium]MBU1924231.1 polyprenyl synthetase family protein [Candidatus Omnitrophota bacterium]